MKTNLIALLLVAAVTVLIFSASLAGLHLYSRPAPLPTVEVMVAARDIREGDKLKASDMVARTIDQSAYIDSMVRADEQSRLVGYEACADMDAGDPIFKGLLALKNYARIQFAPKIATRMRAIAIPVDQFASVGRMVEPGDRVDLLVHLTAMTYDEPTSDGRNLGMVAVPTGIEEPMSIYLLQDVKVLAIDNLMEAMLPVRRELDVDYRSVTLELTPDEVSVVAFALHASRTDNPEGPGPFTLVLRNPQDDGYLEKVQVTRYESLIDLANLEALFQRSKAHRRARGCIYGGGYTGTLKS